MEKVAFTALYGSSPAQIDYGFVFRDSESTFTFDVMKERSNKVLFGIGLESVWAERMH